MLSVWCGFEYEHKNNKKPSWKAPEDGGGILGGAHPQESLDKATESCHYPEGTEDRDDHVDGLRGRGGGVAGWAGGGDDCGDDNS